MGFGGFYHDPNVGVNSPCPSGHTPSLYTFKGDIELHFKCNSLYLISACGFCDGFSNLKG